jgi:hypothetical protein
MLCTFRSPIFQASAIPCWHLTMLGSKPSSRTLQPNGADWPAEHRRQCDHFPCYNTSVAPYLPCCSCLANNYSKKIYKSTVWYRYWYPFHFIWNCLMMLLQMKHFCDALGERAQSADLSVCLWMTHQYSNRSRVSVWVSYGVLKQCNMVQFRSHRYGTGRKNRGQAVTRFLHA